MNPSMGRDGLMAMPHIPSEKNEPVLAEMRWMDGWMDGWIDRQKNN
jgi:hypothetical protein